MSPNWFQERRRILRFRFKGSEIDLVEGGWVLADEAGDKGRTIVTDAVAVQVERLDGATVREDAYNHAIHVIRLPLAASELQLGAMAVGSMVREIMTNVTTLGEKVMEDSLWWRWQLRFGDRTIYRRIPFLSIYMP